MYKSQWLNICTKKLRIFLIFLFAVTFVASNEMFDFNMDKINDVYHRAALMTLLKARGLSLVKSPEIPKSEKIIYQQCFITGNTPMKLAKCVTKLLDFKENSRNFYSQKDSLSAIEKLGEIFFGKKLKPIPDFQVDADDDEIEDDEQPLKRVIPNSISSNPINILNRVNTGPITPLIAAKENYLNIENYQKPNNNFDALVRAKVYRLRNSAQMRPSKTARYFRTDSRKRRWKREMMKQKGSHRKTTDKNQPANFENLPNLEKITTYYKMLSHCERYFKNANHDNSKFVSSTSKLPYQFDIKKDETMAGIENVFEALEGLIGSTAAKSKYSFLSPRLFSIFPSESESEKRKQLLSPSLFSFHENDGFFSLPTLMKKFNFKNNAENEWIETLLEISGASKTLANLTIKLEPEMKAMHEEIYPMVVELEEMDKNWDKVVKSYSPEQKADIAEMGYAFLDSDQLQLVYRGKDRSKLKISLDKYSKLSKAQKQQRIDDDIRKLSKLDIGEEFPRFRRQVVHPDNGEVTVSNDTHHDYSQEAPGSHGSIPHFITLAPWAGGYRIGNGFAFEVVTLSPHAFFAEVMMPAAIGVSTLGPRAFIAGILSPVAIISRILSPSAFHTDILSPRALTAYVLSPEAMVAEILTPKFLEARILSPEAMIIQVLSPSIIAPRVASPEAAALLILSPSILSPRVQSGHTLTVEILSPHILGGGHSSHEDAEQGLPHQHSEDEHKDHRDAKDATQITNHGKTPEAALATHTGHAHPPSPPQGNPHLYGSNIIQQRVPYMKRN